MRLARTRPIESARRVGITLSILRRSRRSGGVFRQPSISPNTFVVLYFLPATLNSRKPFRDFVYCAACGDGTPMYVRASGKPIFDANGAFRGYRGTGTDVTAITRAQEALRESERRARSAIDGIAGLVAILASNGELETANRPLLEYFGRSLEWLKDWATNEVVHPEDLPRSLELFKKA